MIVRSLLESLSHTIAVSLSIGMMKLMQAILCSVMITKSINVWMVSCITTPIPEIINTQAVVSKYMTHVILMVSPSFIIKVSVHFMQIRKISLPIVSNKSEHVMMVSCHEALCIQAVIVLSLHVAMQAINQVSISLSISCVMAEYRVLSAIAEASDGHEHVAISSDSQKNVIHVPQISIPMVYVIHSINHLKTSKQYNQISVMHDQ